MELILKNKNESNKGTIFIVVVTLTLLYGMLVYSNNKSHQVNSYYQQNYMYNSVDTFSVR